MTERPSPANPDSRQGDPSAGGLRTGQRLLRTTLTGALLGAVIALAVGVLPLFFLSAALDNDGEGWAGTATTIVTGAMAIVPISLAFAAVPLLKKARVRPLWSVALISPVATVALASFTLTLSGLEPFAALIGAPFLAAAGYALGAMITEPRLGRRWRILLACATAALIPLTMIIGARSEAAYASVGSQTTTGITRSVQVW
jgi:hypothetical protein